MWAVRHLEEARSRQSEGYSQTPFDLLVEMVRRRVCPVASILQFCRWDLQWGTLPCPTTRLDWDERIYV